MHPFKIFINIFSLLYFFFSCLKSLKKQRKPATFMYIRTWCKQLASQERIDRFGRGQDLHAERKCVRRDSLRPPRAARTGVASGARPLAGWLEGGLGLVVLFKKSLPASSHTLRHWPSPLSLAHPQCTVADQEDHERCNSPDLVP